MVRKILIIFVVIAIISASLISASAYFYSSDNDSFFTETGYTGCSWVKINCSLGVGYLIIPSDRLQYIGSSGGSYNFFNFSSSNINCIFYRIVDDVVFSCRIRSFSSLEYLSSTSGGFQTYSSINVTDIIDMNCDLNLIYPNNDLRSSNLDFDKFEIAVISLLMIILFFVILGWFLLHRL